VPFKPDFSYAVFSPLNVIFSYLEEITQISEQPTASPLT
jgi:hypothetical protein